LTPSSDLAPTVTKANQNDALLWKTAVLISLLLVLEYFVPRPNVGILHTSMPEMLEESLIFYLEFDPTLLTLFPEVYSGMEEC
jgi:hypothetical protein